jgi:hypothetical protein
MMTTNRRNVSGVGLALRPNVCLIFAVESLLEQEWTIRLVIEWELKKKKKRLALIAIDIMGNIVLETAASVLQATVQSLSGVLGRMKFVLLVPATMMHRRL